MESFVSLVEQAFGAEAETRLLAREYEQWRMKSPQDPAIMQKDLIAGFERRAEALIDNYPGISNSVQKLKQFVEYDDIVKSRSIRSALGHVGLYFLYINHAFGMYSDPPSNVGHG